MSTIRTIASGTYGATRQANLLVALRSQLDGMNRQLATGKKSESLGGLGAGRSSAMAMRARLSQSGAYSAVVERGLVRTGLMSGTIDHVTKIAASARSDALAAASATSPISIAASRSRALVGFDGAIGSLNADFDGQYLFSGFTTDTRPVVSSGVMLNGDGSGDGLIRLIDERRQADLGSGTGRLTIGGAGTTVALAEEAAGLPFGIKITAAASTLQGAVLSGPGGAPKGISLDLTSQPLAGQTLTVTLGLPDGTSESIALTATAAGVTNPAGGSFAIGPDAATTASNLRSALSAQISELATTGLEAASTMAAATDFFAGSNSQPVRRVAGPPFATATGFVTDGSRPTVTWYQGDDDPSVKARATQQMTIDHGVTVDVGARANEQPFATMMAGLAALAAEASTAPRLNDGAYRALADRASNALGALDGAGRGIAADVAVTQEAMSRAQSRQKQLKGVYQNVISEVEVPDLEELSTSILALQTRLQASYQVTASLSRMSLADYI